MKINRYLLVNFITLSIFFLPFFANPNLLTSKDNDLGRTYVPLFNFFRNSVFINHQIPLWRPDQLMGESYVGNPISSLFYPANILFLIFPVNFGSVVYYFLHLLIASTGTFYLAKSFSLSSKSSVFAALVFSLSTKMLVHLEAGHITMVAAMSLFPLAFLSFRNLLNYYQPKWLVINSLTLALIYFAYPTIFYYSFIFLGTYWFYWQFKITNISFRKILKSAGIFIISVLTFFLLAAIELIPHLEFAHYSTRSQLKLEDVALPLWNLKLLLSSLAFPYFQNNLNHEAFLYLGFVPLILSFCGFIVLPKFKKAVLSLGFLFSILFIAGLSTPVFPFLYKYLPLLNYSRITTRSWFIVALIVSLLAAYALNRIKNQKIVYVAAVLYILEITFIFSQRQAKIPSLSFTNEKLYQHITGDHDIFRVYCTTNCFNPQMLSGYNIQILNGENPIQQKSTVDYLQVAGSYKWPNFAVIFPPYQVWQQSNPPIPDAKKLGDANTKYVASTYSIDDKDLVFEGQFENIYLYKNTQFKPRFYFESPQEALIINSLSPNQINLKFERQKTSKTIVISQNYYPGWIASVVNQKFNVASYNQVFQSVAIPSDTEDVWLKFQPKSYIMGRTITLGTIIFLLLYLYKFKNKKREK